MNVAKKWEKTLKNKNTKHVSLKNKKHKMFLHLWQKMNEICHYPLRERQLNCSSMRKKYSVDWRFYHVKPRPHQLQCWSNRQQLPVASTLLLVWTGLYTQILQPWQRRRRRVVNQDRRQKSSWTDLRAVHKVFAADLPWLCGNRVCGYISVVRRNHKRRLLQARATSYSACVLWPRTHPARPDGRI